MDSITRIKEFIKSNFPDWEKICLILPWVDTLINH